MRRFALLVLGLALALVQQGCDKTEEKAATTATKTTKAGSFLATEVAVETEQGVALNEQLGKHPHNTRAADHHKHTFLETKLQVEEKAASGEKHLTPVVAH